MNNSELAFTSALTLSQLIRQGELSPLELTQLYLDRIDRWDGELGSFVHVARETALADAQRKTEQLARTKDRDSLPIFFGIPTAVKDLYPVKGMPCCLGNAALREQMFDYDAGIVTRLRQAGFIILGKTATSELGSLPYTECENFPPSRNPWHLDYTSGGSSGGAAAAVAAGLIPVAQGSDGGGSVRGPASCCGLVGLKPSRGRVTNAPVGDYPGGIATHGCLSRNVADTAALLDVLSGYAVGDPYWLPNPDRSFLELTLEAREKPPEPLKIAFATSIPPVGAVHPLLKEQVEETGRILEKMGHSLTEACPDFSPLVEPFIKIWQAGIVSAGVPPRILSPINQWLVRETGTLESYLLALQQMQVISRQIVAFFADFDLLLLPTYMYPPIKVGQWADLSFPDTLTEIINWVTPCPPFNATGQPAIALPTGFTPEGLPIGVQLAGKPADEVTILQVAAAIEREIQWQNHRPSNFSE